jgi:hypothetical protein
MGGELIGPARMAQGAIGLYSHPPNNTGQSVRDVNNVVGGAFQSPGPGTALIPGAVPAIATLGPISAGASALATKAGADPDEAELAGNAAAIAAPFAHPAVARAGNLIKTYSPEIGRAAGYGASLAKVGSSLIHGKIPNIADALYATPLITKPVSMITHGIGAGIEAAGGMPAPLIDLGEFTPTAHSDVIPTSAQNTGKFARNVMGMRSGAPVNAPVPNPSLLGRGPLIPESGPVATGGTPEAAPKPPTSGAPRVQIERGKGGKMTKVYPPATVEPGTPTIMNPGKIEHPWITGTAPQVNEALPTDLIKGGAAAEVPQFSSGGTIEPKGEVFPPDHDEENLVKDGFLKAPKNVTPTFSIDDLKAPQDFLKQHGTPHDQLRTMKDTDIVDQANELHDYLSTQGNGQTERTRIATPERVPYDVPPEASNFTADEFSDAQKFLKQNGVFASDLRTMPDTEIIQRARDLKQHLDTQTGSAKPLVPGASQPEVQPSETPSSQSQPLTNEPEKPIINTDMPQESVSRFRFDENAEPHGSVQGDFSLHKPTSFYHGSSNPNLINTGIEARVSPEVRANHPEEHPDTFKGVFLGDNPDAEEVRDRVPGGYWGGEKPYKVDLPKGSQMRVDPHFGGNPFEHIDTNVIHMGDIPSGRVSTPEDTLETKGIQEAAREDLDKGQAAADDLERKQFYKNNKPGVSKTTGQRYNPDLHENELLPWAQTPWGGEPEFEPQEGASASVKPPKNTANFVNPFSGNYEPDPKFSADELNDLYRGDVLDTMAKTHGELIHMPPEPGRSSLKGTSGMIEGPDDDYVRNRAEDGLGTPEEEEGMRGPNKAAEDLNMPKGDQASGDEQQFLDSVRSEIEKNGFTFKKDARAVPGSVLGFNDNNELAILGPDGYLRIYELPPDVYKAVLEKGTADLSEKPKSDEDYLKDLSKGDPSGHMPKDLINWSETADDASHWLVDNGHLRWEEANNMAPDDILKTAEKLGFKLPKPPQDAKDIIKNQNNKNISDIVNRQIENADSKPPIDDSDSRNLAKDPKNVDSAKFFLRNQMGDYEELMEQGGLNPKNPIDIIEAAKELEWDPNTDYQKPGAIVNMDVDLGSLDEESKKFSDKYGGKGPALPGEHAPGSRDVQDALEYLEENDILNNHIRNSSPADIMRIARDNGWKMPVDTNLIKNLIDSPEPNINDLREKRREDLIDTRGVAQEMRERAAQDKRRPYK